MVEEKVLVVSREANGGFPGIKNMIFISYELEWSGKAIILPCHDY